MTSYGYDAVSRLASLGHDLVGTGADVTTTFTHNPASQIAGVTRSNDLYAFPDFTNVNRTDTINGLNQVTATGGSSVTHDARGNVTAIGGSAYSYRAENLLTSGGGTALAYDPLLRLYEVSQGSPTRFVYDGHDLIGEYDAVGALDKRYVHGPGMDEPLVWYQGSGTGDRRWLHADERGSIIATSDGTGTSIITNRYDAYGVPESGNGGRFGYTGQVWLPGLGAYYYKARVYNPVLGRFMQTDPIGYGDGLNLYGYVGGDPVNFTDPSGTEIEYPVTGRLSGGSGSVIGGLSSGTGYVGEGGSTFADDPETINIIRSRARSRNTQNAIQDSAAHNVGIEEYVIIAVSSEHTKGKRPSTKGKHEAGQARKDADQGGEKGDARRRPPRKPPAGWKGPWPPKKILPFFIPEWMLNPCINPWSEDPMCTNNIA